MFHLYDIVCDLKTIWGNYHNYMRRNWERKLRAWPLITKLGLWTFPDTLWEENKINALSFFKYSYIFFHSRISQHLTNSILLKRKKRKQKVINYIKAQLTVSRSLQEGQKPTWPWGRSRAQGKEAPSDFKWMTLQKPPRVPISMQWHAHSKSHWWVPTAASQGKVRGRYKFKSWLYLGPSPGTSLFRACKTPSLKRSSDNPQSSHKDHWGGRGGSLRHTDLQATKCYLNISHWLHMEIWPQTLSLQASWSLCNKNVCFMILSRLLTLCWDCSRTGDY